MVKNYFLHKVVPFLIFYHIPENATALGEQKVGSMYVDGFVLRQFIEHQPNWLNECQQYKTAYVELTFTHPML